jgi:hypothetical protein
MKKHSIFLLLGVTVAFVLFLNGCGLVSGTAFISQSLDNSIEAQSSASVQHGGPNGRFDSFGGAKVDLRDNSDWKDITIEGIEDICVRLTAVNMGPDSVSGEAWVTVGEDSTYGNIAAVQAAGGFRIFSGVLMGPAGSPTDSITYPCSETFHLFENLDRLVDAVKTGVFWVWGRGDQPSYHFRYDAIYLGIHVTGSR